MRRLRPGIIWLEGLALLVTAACFLLLRTVSTEGPVPWTVLGLSFVLLAGYLTGRIVKHFHLPAMTGYVIAGVVGGPFLGNILTQESIGSLHTFDDMALAVIAFMAGGEIVAKEMKQDVKLLLVSFFYINIIGVMMLVLLGWPLLYLPMFSHIKGPAIFLFLAFFAILVLAKSPAATTAIIQETGIKNRLAKIVLVMVVLVDVATIVFFALARGVGKVIVQGAQDASILKLLGKVVVWDILGSLAAGLLLGWLLSMVFKVTGLTGEVMSLLVASYFIILIEHQFHLHFLLICLAAGFFVQNFTTYGGRFIHRLENISLPLFLLLFTLTAAGLDIRTALAIFPIALAVTLANAGLMWLQLKLSCRGSKLPPKIRNNIWLGLVSKAGVSFGLAGIVERSFPQLIPADGSRPFTTLIISVITLHLIFGPLLFKMALKRSIKPDLDVPDDYTAKPANPIFPDLPVDELRAELELPAT